MISGLSTKSIAESAREAVFIESVSNPFTIISMVGSCPMCDSACKRCGCACDGVEPRVELARSTGQRGPKRL